MCFGNLRTSSWWWAQRFSKLMHPGLRNLRKREGLKDYGANCNLSQKLSATCSLATKDPKNRVLIIVKHCHILVTLSLAYMSDQLTSPTPSSSHLTAGLVMTWWLDGSNSPRWSRTFDRLFSSRMSSEECKLRWHSSGHHFVGFNNNLIHSSRV